jgi:hypothetical protein
LLLKLERRYRAFLSGRERRSAAVATLAKLVSNFCAVFVVLGLTAKWPGTTIDRKTT